MRGAVHKLGRFVGRKAEMVELRRLFDEHRLVTLVGPGGCGKTRLALEVAGDVARFEDGLAVVELAELAESAGLEPALARATAIRVETRDALVDALSRRSLLVLLDNCEHLTDACAALAADLVERCPRLGVLATSREPLGLPGEVVWHVPPLSLPDSAGDGTAPSDAVALFVDRARAASRSFALNAGNAGAIAEICRRLDGLPLAIELAAARVRVASPAELVERLERDSELLRLSSRSATSRHRTLRATIGWSWRTLPEDERRLLARMAVFAGETDAVAVEAVCPESRPALDRLVERSLVVATPGTPSSYRLLEMIRQFALEKLEAAGEVDSARLQHAEYFTARCEGLRPYERGSHPGEIEDCLSNVRAALRFLAGSPSQHNTALASRLVDTLFVHWMRLGSLGEGRRAAEAVLRAADRAGALASPAVSRVAGVFAWLAGDGRAAAHRFAAAIDAGDVLARSFESQLAIGEGRMDDARRGAAEACGAAAEAPDFVRIMALTNLGNALRACGDLVAGQRTYADCLALSEQLGNEWARAMALRNLATVAFLRDDYAMAEAHLVESLGACRAIGDVWFASRGVEALAQVAAARGEHERAAHMFGAGAALRDSIGVEVLAMYKPGYDAARAAAHAGLGADGFARAFERGRAMSLADAIADVGGEASTDLLRIAALGHTSVVPPRSAAPSPDRALGKPMELLVFLLCHGPCSREQIGLALWPDATPTHMRNSLNVAVHRLRRALGDGARIVHADGTYSFNRALPYAFDVEAFESALAEAQRGRDGVGKLEAFEAALELYTGDFLADRPAADWIVPRAQSLARAYLDALVEAGALALSSGESRRAVEHLEKAVAADPYCERAHRGVALALARQGNRAAALQRLELLDQLLDAELQVGPSAATRALEARIRGGDPLEDADFTGE